MTSSARAWVLCFSLAFLLWSCGDTGAGTASTGGVDGTGATTASSGTGGTGASPDGSAMMCPAGQTPCGSRCVDTTSDAENCGACDHACAAHQTCSSGSCVGTANSGGASGTGAMTGGIQGMGATGTGGGSTGGTAAGGQSSGGTTIGGQATGGQATGGQATGGQASGGQNTGGTGADVQNSGGTAIGGQGSGGESMGGESMGGATTGGESAGGTTTGGQATGGQSTGGDASGFDPRNPAFILGADVSWIQEQEDQGRRFSDQGAQKDIFSILKEHGFNYIRLRLFHDPGAPGGYQHEFVERAEPYCDTEHTIEVGKRVKAAGLGFSLDFHYSDTWADPDDQNKPQAWSSYGLSQLVTAVHDYTVDTLLAFEAAGALPDMVQVGNEITPGMLLPEGSSSNFGNLSQLLEAGVAAIDEVDSGILKVMHIEGPHKPDTISWWAKSAVDSGVEFDILGVSCYSAWHEGPSRWQSTFERVASEHPNLKFMIAEYADNYRAANDIMHDLPQGVGTMFWEPTADGEWGQGLFDSNGRSRSELLLYDEMASDYGLR